MAGKDNKPLSTMALKAMKPGDKPLADVGENRGLRVMCGNGGTKTFIYRYKSPVTKADSSLHERRHFAVQAFDLRLEALAHLLHRQPGIVRVQDVGGFHQLVGCVVHIGEDDTVLHVTLGGDDDDQQASFG